MSIIEDDPKAFNADGFFNIGEKTGGGLTRRQKQVLKLVAQGMSGKEAAMCLGLRVSTVTTHLKQAYRKLGIHNRAEAVKMVLINGVSDNLGTQTDGLFPGLLAERENRQRQQTKVGFANWSSRNGFAMTPPTK